MTAAEFSLSAFILAIAGCVLFVLGVVCGFISIVSSNPDRRSTSEICAASFIGTAILHWFLAGVLGTIVAHL